ncbi:MAG: glycine cleavage system protein GcvH [Candidatus Riflebacteria bacterium]|nr:glycine cleavage system protein GcvH [Candidatus Riflebacteria bacterium]
MNPKEIKYTKSHEWAAVKGNIAVIGISDFASKQLGDIVFVDAPKVGLAVTKGKTFGVIESVKTVSDLYSPFTGKIIKTNDALESDPAKVNEDPCGSGWICEIELSNPTEAKELMDFTAYEKHCAESHH